MSFLDDLPGDLYDGLADDMRDGTIYRRSTTAGAGNSYGDPASPVPSSTPCKGFRDDYTLAFKLAAGLPESDAKICILGASLPSGFLPRQDDCVFIESRWYQLRQGKTDPASALWEMPGYEINDPTV